MPNAALPLPAEIPVTSSLSDDALRMTRVLLVSLGLFAVFFAIEHDASVAGLQPTANPQEDKVLDEFVGGN